MVKLLVVEDAFVKPMTSSAHARLRLRRSAWKDRADLIGRWTAQSHPAALRGRLESYPEFGNLGMDIRFRCRPSFSTEIPKQVLWIAVREIMAPTAPWAPDSGLREWSCTGKTEPGGRHSNLQCSGDRERRAPPSPWPGVYPNQGGGAGKAKCPTRIQSGWQRGWRHEIIVALFATRDERLKQAFLSALDDIRNAIMLASWSSGWKRRAAQAAKWAFA